MEREQKMSSFHHALMLTYFSFQKVVMGEARRLGLSPGQPKILDFLAEHEDVEQKTIAKSCEIERASAGSILDGMESAGLIERRRKEGNRRSLYVRLTPKGRSLALEVRELFRRAEDRALAGLSEHGRQGFTAMLLAVYNNITSEADNDKDGHDGEQQRQGGHKES